MNNILTLTKLTIREAFARKIFIVFFGVSTFVILMAALVFSLFSFEDLTGSITINSEQIDDIGVKLVETIQLFILSPLFGLGLFLSIFSTSSFIPNMLEKGSIDLLLSKPVSRTQVILGKFFGGTMVVFINIAYLIVGLWFLLGIKFGSWNAGFLLSIPVITFAFSTLYSMIILIGVVTRSSVLAMMLSYLIFIVFSPLLAARENIYMLIENKIAQFVIDAIYYIIPKTTELGSIMADVATGYGIDDFQPIITSFLFIILTIYLSITIFSKKDY